MPLRSIHHIPVSAKRVLVRVGLDIPVAIDGTIGHEESWRLESMQRTIRALVAGRKQIILMGHRGRPEGKEKKEWSLAPLVPHLSKLFGKKVYWSVKTIGPSAVRTIHTLRPGQILLLENLRFHTEETDNDPAFAKALASLADAYVNESFDTCHRAHASVVGVPRCIPGFAGIHLLEEINALDRVRTHPKKPVVLIVGGIKMETKFPLIRQYLPVADHILLGGGAANTLLASRGWRIGPSVADWQMQKEARALSRNPSIILPTDVVVANSSFSALDLISISKKHKQLCTRKQTIVDIGPETIGRYAALIRDAKTIIWNGPMGYFEQEASRFGTMSMARMVASHAKDGAYGVVGGGETVQALRMSKMESYVDHVSVGGGAMLVYLSGTQLPGILALRRRSSIL